ncbi:hypothetical protein ACKKBG_A14970 [Auxenochlorella protothecoides x Auxenochlorella symbiontica]
MVVWVACVLASLALQQTVRAQVVTPLPPILLNAPLAESEVPANGTCPPFNEDEIDPVTLMPKEGYRLVFESESEEGSNRIYTCLPDLTVSYTPFTANVLFGGSEYDAASRNDQFGTAVVKMYEPGNRTQYLGEYYVDTGRGTVYPSPDGSENLSWARTPIYIVAGDVPYLQYIVRSRTEGGVPPASCTEPGKEVLVPFRSHYSFYSCD